MIKKLMIVLSLCMFSMSVYAADGADLTNVGAEFATDGMSVLISADAPDLPQKELIIKITDSGYSDTDISPAHKDALLFLDDCTVQNDGKLNVSFNFANQIKDGRYCLYITGENIESKKIELWYMKDTAREELIKSIMQSKNSDELEKLLFDDKIQYADGEFYNAAQRLSLTNSAYSEKYNSYIANVLFADNPQNYDEFKYTFRKASLMAAVYFGDYSTITDKDYNLTVNVWKNTDSAYTAYGYYKDLLSTQSKQQLVKSLTDKKITQSSVFDDEFIKQTIYFGTYGADIKGYGHICKMYDTLLPITGSDFGKYFNITEQSKSQLCSDLYLSQQGDYDGIRLYIYTNSYNFDNNKSGGSGSKSGTSSGSGGVGTGDIFVESGYNNNNTFADLDGFDWAKDAVYALKARGIVNGVSQKSFEPQRSITREEFVKMLVVSLNLNTNANAAFDDVKADMWYTPYIGAAIKNNLTNGISDTLFGIGTQISRQDCAVFIYRALKDKLNIGESQLLFDDSSDIADYAKDAVQCLTNNGIIMGDNNKFMPNGNASRAEVCVMLYRLIDRGYIK